jgi:putative transposase
MNNRDYKAFASNTCWHVYNRGNRKQDIFLDNSDYIFFLRRLKEYLYPIPLKIPIKGFSDGNLQGGASLVEESHTPYIRKSFPPDTYALLSYCLMPNHFHLEIKQNTDTPVSKLISRLGTSYSKYFNRKYNKVGGVFQDAFKACLIDNDSYLLWLSAYIHNNPKVGGLVESPDEYPWSSYQDYIGLRNGTLCKKKLILENFTDVNEYKLFVDESREKILAMKLIQNYLID